MKKFLQDLIARKNTELANLKKRSDESTDLNEVRNIGSQMDSVRSEINDAQSKLNEIEAEERATAQEADSRNGFNPAATVAATDMNQNAARSEDEDSRGTMDYRKAFMDYIQRGIVNKDVLQFEKRDNAAGLASDLGVLIPSTVIQKIIEGVEKVYGTIYSKVKKTNLPGGVKYPIGSFSATFNRITETTVSDRQKAGGVTGSVEFSYKIGEIRLARTLLQTVLSVPVFEQKFAEIIVKAYVEAMDKEIMTGKDASNQLVGILSTEGLAKIPAGNIIEFTADEIGDWTAWEKKFFANIPLSLENAFSEFVMAKQTYVSNLVTMKDSNGQPINKAGFDVTDKQHKFNEYNVNRTEQDIFKSFDLCGDGEYFGMFWNPEEAYAINSNMEFTVIDYFDQETNQYVKKALVINDGKILDPKYIYLLKKKVSG